MVDCKDEIMWVDEAIRGAVGGNTMNQKACSWSIALLFEAEAPHLVGFASKGDFLDEGLLCGWSFGGDNGWIGLGSGGSRGCFCFRFLGLSWFG